MPTEIYFATNRTQPRRRGGPFGNRFHTDGPHFYEVGCAMVTWRDPEPETRNWDTFEVSYELQPGRRPRLEEVPEDSIPEMHRKRSMGERTGSASTFEHLRQEMQETNRDILVFIHGFANSFESSVARAAQLKESYKITPAEDDQPGEPYEPYVFMFSWPSDVGGENRGPWVRLYMDGRDGKEWLWCAGFVCFILRQACAALDQPLPFPGTVSCDVLAVPGEGPHVGAQTRRQVTDFGCATSRFFEDYVTDFGWESCGWWSHGFAGAAVVFGFGWRGF